MKPLSVQVGLRFRLLPLPLGSPPSCVWGSLNYLRVVGMVPCFREAPAAGVRRVRACAEAWDRIPKPFKGAGLGFRVWGWGRGFGVWGLGFRVEGLGWGV